MGNKILLVLLLSFAPIMIAIIMLLLFLVYWLATSSFTFIEFMQLPTDQTMGNATLIIGGISALSATLLTLNLIVLLNTRFHWVSNEQIKNKIGKDISRYVYFPNT